MCTKVRWMGNGKERLKAKERNLKKIQKKEIQKYD
jgi:hypothetical protein